MSAETEATVFRYNPFKRLPMIVGVTLFGAVGCLSAAAQILAGPSDRRVVLLAVVVALFLVVLAACWVLWLSNLIGGPAARLTPGSAELRGFGGRAVIDRTRPDLKFEWLLNGVLVQPASAVTILKRGLLRGRTLADGRAYVPIEHRSVWNRSGLVTALGGWRQDL